MLRVAVGGGASASAELIRSRKSAPDLTLLSELVNLRQLTVNLFSALASDDLSTATVPQTVKQADHVKARPTRFCDG